MRFTYFLFFLILLCPILTLLMMGVDHSPQREHGNNRYDTGGSVDANPEVDSNDAALAKVRNDDDAETDVRIKLDKIFDSKKGTILKEKKNPIDHYNSKPSSNWNAAGFSLNESTQEHEVIISLYSLLNQFSSSTVRGDFLHKKFGFHLNPEILPKLDELKWTIMPRWSGVGLWDQDPRRRTAAIHLKKLLNRSSEVFDIETGATYAWWMSTLHMLSMEPYWELVPPSERCAHYSEETRSNVLPASSNVPSVSSDVQRKVLDTQPAIPIHEKQVRRSKRKVKVEEIIISSTSEYSDDSSSKEYDSSSSNDSSRSPVLRRSRRLRKHSVVKSVVTPPTFEMNGKMHLKEFFKTFELYFKNKFKGSSFDQTQMLSTFLTGDLLKVYEVRGGRKLRYDKMKRELLAYYKKQKIGGKRYWRKQLDNATIEDGEGLDIFGMRLAELARLAYPNDDKECASHLRSRFLKVIPENILNKILESECARKAASGGKKKYLPFSSLTMMANDLYAVRPKQKSVMWTSDLSAQKEVEVPSQVKQTKQSSYPQGARAKVFSKKEGQHPSSRPDCTYCHRSGHARKDC